MKQQMNWQIYLILCADHSLYCGISNRLAVRWQAHCTGKAARYTKMRGVMALRVVACCLDKSQALKGELMCKRLSRKEKWQLWECATPVFQAADN